jgi:hypothetical protein
VGVAEHFVSLTRDGELDLATPADPNTLYNPVVKAFERSIVRLNRGDLKAILLRCQSAVFEEVKE